MQYQEMSVGICVCQRSLTQEELSGVKGCLQGERLYPKYTLSSRAERFGKESNRDFSDQFF